MLRLATLCRNSFVRFVLCKLWNGSLASAQAKTRAPNKTRALRQRTKAFQKIPSSLLDGSQTETSPARTRTAALYLRFPDFGFTITSMPRRECHVAPVLADAAARVDVRRYGKGQLRRTRAHRRFDGKEVVPTQAHGHAFTGSVPSPALARQRRRHGRRGVSGLGRAAIVALHTPFSSAIAFKNIPKIDYWLSASSTRCG